MRVERNGVSAFHALLLAAAVALLAASTCPGTAAQATGPLRGVALILGQSDYDYLPKLANPANDARAIEGLLNGLGFETDIATNRTARRLKRDIEAFAEDAEGADVALVYYSGHGIEAGGEDFLLPVDADLQSLEDASGEFTTLSAVLEGLRSRAKIAIVLIDACRTNPFPAGTTIRLQPGGPATAIGAAGLVAIKGAESAFLPVDPDSGADGSLGAVIGFAAAPGQAALDGDAGGNSPYAAALLKHLSARNLEFGQVMTLVAEEVYLATRGRQQPWTNASLRRLLFFGGNPEQGTGDEAMIRGERRNLLLTIAATPDDLRRTVETIAGADDVPLDGLYAMLASLGVEAPADRDGLGRQLRAGAEKLKGFLNAQTALTSADPEIVRLSNLAEKAVEEGALQAAAAFRERAKARVASLEASVGEVEAEIKARRLEFGEVFAKSAETSELAFDYLKAAQDWAKAFAEVERWDDYRAFVYKVAEADALNNHGDFKGDNDALRQSVELYGRALRLASRELHPDSWAMTQNKLGTALVTLGEREGDSARLEEAVTAFRASLEARPRERDPRAWAAVQNNLGNALQQLGERETGTGHLKESVTAYQAALEEYTRDRAPLDWAGTQNNLGNTLTTLGGRESGTGHLDEAVMAYRAALEEWTRERAPLDWATAQNNLGNALQRLGERDHGGDHLEQAIVAYRAALTEWTRERVPLRWAMAQHNLGTALETLGEIDGDAERLEEAVVALRAALEERTPERVPLDWAAAQNSLGNALSSLGEREAGSRRLEEAAVAYRAALEEWTRERVPLDWAMAEHNLATTLRILGEREDGTERLEQAVAAYRAALMEWTRERAPLDWARAQDGLGWTLKFLGQRKADRSLVESGRQSVVAAWDLYRSAGYSYGEYFMERLFEFDRVLTEMAPPTLR